MVPERRIFEGSHQWVKQGLGGWLDLPHGGLSPPILCQLPGALGSGSWSCENSDVRFAWVWLQIMDKWDSTDVSTFKLIQRKYRRSFVLTAHHSALTVCW